MGITHLPLWQLVGLGVVSAVQVLALVYAIWLFRLHRKLAKDHVHYVALAIITEVVLWGAFLVWLAQMPLR